MDWENAGFSLLETGKAEKLCDGETVAVIAAGPFANRALEAASQIEEEYGWSPAVYNIRYIKPVDTGLLAEVAQKFERVMTVEDGTVLGGLYGAVAEYMANLARPVHVTPVGIPDRYIGQGAQAELREECGLTSAAIKIEILKQIEKI